MTVDDKNKMLKAYCNGRACDDCPLNTSSEYCKESYENEPELLEHNFKLVFGDITTEDPIKPDYYNDTKITPFDVIDDWELNFYLGNAIKYIKRAGKKEGNSRLQDLKKIREYIEHEIHDEEGVI